MPLIMSSSRGPEVEPKLLACFFGESPGHRIVGYALRQFISPSAALPESGTGVLECFAGHASFFGLGRRLGHGNSTLAFEDLNAFV